MIVDLQECFVPNKHLVEKIKERTQISPLVLQTKQTKKNPLFKEVLGWDPPEEALKLVLPNTGIVLEKEGYGLNPKDLERVQELLEPYNCIEVCGAEIDGGVLSICFQLWDIGIRPLPIFGLCGGQDNRLESQSVMIRQFGPNQTAGSPSHSKIFIEKEEE